MKRFATAVGLLFWAVSPAFAQDAIVEGPGYQVSEGTVLHPSVGLQAGMISNVFYEETDPVASPVIKLLADLDFATRPPQRYGTEPGLDGEGVTVNEGTPPAIDFRAGVRLTYSEYLTSNDAAQAQRDLGIGANVAFVAFPHGKVTFTVKDDFAREVRATNFESTNDLDRDVNHLLLGVTAKPGGGALAFGARYENTIDRFEDDETSFANRLHQLVGASIEWQFLPVTKFTLDGSYGFYSQLGDGSGTDLDKVSANPLRVQAGIATALIEVLTVKVRAGYAQGFYAAGPDYQGPLIGAELGVRYSPTGRIVGSYDHDYSDSINANFYAEHRGRLEINQQIARLMVLLAGEVRFRAYQGVPMTLGAMVGRDDVILAAIAEARYVVRDWLALTADYHFSVVETDFRYDAAGFPDDPSYNRHEVFLGARASF